MTAAARHEPSAVPALVLILLTGGAVVAATQPGLATTLHETKERQDVYLFPPPAELKLATLGYDAATVDMLWAKLRVEYGMHWAEKRTFPDASRYMDAILELEPDYAPVYHYADTLLVYHYPVGTEQDVRTARRILERGTRERPDDYEVWEHYGQFLAFMAPTYLSSKAEAERWRADGAHALSRAVELGDDPSHSISAAYLLDRQGQRNAAIVGLERAYALADDPQTRAGIAAKLAELHASDVRERAQHDQAVIELGWRGTYPFVTRGEYMLLAPRRDTLACAGLRPGDDPLRCAADWTAALAASRAAVR